MSAHKLSPRLQHQIVHGLGWRSLRPVQVHAIEAILSGENALVLAPTAGGKTEAALLPLLSMMDTECWSGSSILYVAPLRALLNNQGPRLTQLAGLLDRRAFKWHGDVSAAAKKKLLHDPADILATTPESLEAILIRADGLGLKLLGGVRAVVMDEAHALAGSDRGGHLMALLERISRLSGRDLQRVALSATVGNPEALLGWLSGSSRRPQRVVRGGVQNIQGVSGGATEMPVLSLDYVGSLENAALVISALGRGEKRLVFVESRRDAEALGADLRARGVDAHVIHGSLSAKERQQTERVFEESRDSVIVSTSAMELGIDIGDLDRVIQVEAPTSVSSMLQRMGRSGRRVGQRTNYTILATTDEGLWRGAALMRLHGQGFVEDVRLASAAFPLLAQQIMALALQGQGAEAASWWSWLEGAAAFAGIDAADRATLIQWMLDQGLLTHMGGRLCLGVEGERRFGRRHMMDLCALFASPPEVEVLYQGQVIGSIDSHFAQRHDEHHPISFLLGGKRWRLVHMDWRAAQCLVEPLPEGPDVDPPRWQGGGVEWGEALCLSMRDVIESSDVPDFWSRRACVRMGLLRSAHLAHCNFSPFRFWRDQGKGQWRCWTYGGGRANTLLAEVLSVSLGRSVVADNLQLGVRLLPTDDPGMITDILERSRQPEVWTRNTHEAVARLAGRRWAQKFLDCLPYGLICRWLESDWLA